MALLRYLTNNKAQTLLVFCAGLTILLCNTGFMNTKQYTLLCLGDSYTIGESVEEKERFPEQAVAMLQAKGISFAKPEIIAKTGWTTDELAGAIKERNLTGTYDFVTLLIGVNNQYRGRDLQNYRAEFADLLQTALQYAGGDTSRVVVISIPDWGVTPFVTQDAKQRSAGTIAHEIDAFNAVNHGEANKAHVHYLEITYHSRLAATDTTLIASDGLHPSGKMYATWAFKLAEYMAGSLHPTQANH